MCFRVVVANCLQDEIDALASSRSSTSSSDGGSNEGVLISLLNEMDGVQELVGVIVVAATNRPEVIVSHSLSVKHLSLFMNWQGLCLTASRQTRSFAICWPSGCSR
jgi:ATPase family associated with various cellular activities (AAA)